MKRPRNLTLRNLRSKKMSSEERRIGTGCLGARRRHVSCGRQRQQHGCGHSQQLSLQTTQRSMHTHSPAMAEACTSPILMWLRWGQGVVFFENNIFQDNVAWGRGGGLAVPMSQKSGTCQSPIDPQPGLHRRWRPRHHGCVKGCGPRRRRRRGAD